MLVLLGVTGDDETVGSVDDAHVLNHDTVAGRVDLGDETRHTVELAGTLTLKTNRVTQLELGELKRANGCLRLENLIQPLLVGGDDLDASGVTGKVEGLTRTVRQTVVGGVVLEDDVLDTVELDERVRAKLGSGSHFSLLV